MTVSELMQVLQEGIDKGKWYKGTRVVTYNHCADDGTTYGDPDPERDTLIQKGGKGPLGNASPYVGPEGYPKADRVAVVVL
jgi:hypothetical protein